MLAYRLYGGLSGNKSTILQRHTTTSVYLEKVRERIKEPTDYITAITQPIHHLLRTQQGSNRKGTHTVYQFYCRSIVVVILTYYTNSIVWK
jgi:hypothetical protein